MRYLRRFSRGAVSVVERSIPVLVLCFGYELVLQKLVAVSRVNENACYGIQDVLEVIYRAHYLCALTFVDQHA